MSSSVRAIQAENQSISQEIRISQYHKFEIINEHFKMSNASHALTGNQHFSRPRLLYDKISKTVWTFLKKILRDSFNNLFPIKQITFTLW